MSAKKHSRQLLEQRCTWIRQHWDAETLDVPDEFLQRWMYDPGDEEPKPSGFHVAVFIFGYPDLPAFQASLRFEYYDNVISLAAR